MAWIAILAPFSSVQFPRNFSTFRIVRLSTEMAWVIADQCETCKDDGMDNYSQFDGGLTK
jgi:hypothetical protein